MGLSSFTKSFRFAASFLFWVSLLILIHVPARAQITFDKPDIDVGRGPVSIAQADFNGDGRPDLVTANSADNTISILLNNGNNTFSRQDYLTALHPNVAVVADFSGDGIPDVAVGGDTGITIFFGSKAGELSRVAFIATPSEITGMVAVDFNRDGKIDLATVSGRTGVVSIYTGTGSFTFFHVADYTTSVSTSSVGFASNIVAADFNGDGILDMAVANGNSKEVAIFLGVGHAAFTQAAGIMTTDVAVAALAVADFNQDGKPDLLVTTERCDSGRGGGCSFIITIYAGEGNGTFTQQGANFVGYGGQPAILDLNRDGIPDIANPVLFADVEVSITDPQRPLAPNFSDSFPTGLGTASLAVGDFNGDGFPDIATANSSDDTVTILFSDGRGKLHSHLRAPLNFFSEGPVVPADLNGDGVIDLVFGVSNSPGVWISLGRGDGTFANPQQTQADFHPEQIVVADVNGDGIPDLVLKGDDLSPGILAPAIRILLGKGNGEFNKAFQFPGTTDKLFVGDFNGDGMPDILLRFTSLSVFLGNGDGTFRSGGNTPYVESGFFVSGVAAGDFDGDGRLDLIMSFAPLFTNSPKIEFFAGNGDGTFRAGRTLAALSGDVLGAADFNRDGVLDFVASHGPAITLFLGNGDGTFAQGPGLPLFNGNSSNFSISDLKIADLNNDGFPDLIVGEGRISIFMNNGDGTFQRRQDFAIGGVGLLAIADFNGDGKPDVAAFGQALAMLVNTSTPPHPDFKLTLHNAEVTLNAGQSTVVEGTVAALGSFTFGISFSCSGLPRGASCTFNPANISLIAGATPTVNLTIATSGPVAGIVTPPASLPVRFAFLFPVLGALIARFRKGKVRLLVVLVLLLVCISLTGGCGAVNNTQPNPGTPVSATPAGSYQITVTAMSDNPDKTAHTQTILLTVH